MTTTNRWTALILTALLFGILMAVRHELSGIAIRAIVAGLAFVVMAWGVRAFRRGAVEGGE